MWRDIQEQADRLGQRRRGQGVRVLGVGGAYPRLKGKKRAVLMALDLGDGQLLALAQVDAAIRRP